MSTNGWRRSSRMSEISRSGCLMPTPPRSHASTRTATASSPRWKATSTPRRMALRTTTRLFLPATAFNRFAVTREINDGLLAPRFAPSQRAWVLTGYLVKVDPSVAASDGRDSNDR